MKPVLPAPKPEPCRCQKWDATSGRVRFEGRARRPRRAAAHGGRVALPAAPGGRRPSFGASVVSRDRSFTCLLPAKNRPRAFTLIEVLVSLAIFALAAVVLSGTYINILTSYDAVSRRNEHEQELRLVRAQVLGEADRKKVEEGGDFTLPDQHSARWQAKIDETSVADLFRVSFSCEISDVQRADHWKQEETFMLLRPSWSDPLQRDKLRAAAKERLGRREKK